MKMPRKTNIDTDFTNVQESNDLEEWLELIYAALSDES